MRSIKRIINIHQIDGYKVYCLFNNGESRIIDFQQLFHDWEVGRGDIEFPLLTSQEEFSQVEVIDGTLVWRNIHIESENDCAMPKSIYNMGNCICHMLTFIYVICRFMSDMRYLICCMFSFIRNVS